MDLAFDESLFKKIIAALMIAIVIVGVVAVLWFTGILGSNTNVPSPVGPGTTPTQDPFDPYPEDEEEQTVAGLKSYTWSYKETEMEMEIYISNDTYQQFVSSSYGIYEDKPQRMAEYVVTEGDDEIIETLANKLLTFSRDLGYGDSDTVANVLAFVASLDYTTDEERRDTPDYPNYPVITLASEEGDSEDHSILAAAILNKMGYGVGLLYYPAKHDRRTIIPEATALALVTDGTVPGRSYAAIAKAPGGKIVYYPENGTVSATLPDNANRKSGWYSGNAVWYNATDSGTFDNFSYYPANGTFVPEKKIPGIERIVVEDAVWNQPIAITAAWPVDTADKGVPQSAYDGMTPFFNGGDGLWLGWTLSRDDRFDAETTIAGEQPLGEAPSFSANDSLTAALRIPVTSDPSPPLTTWLELVQDYYTNSWYPAGISWNFDDKWKLHDNVLKMQDPLLRNPDAYSLWGVTEVIAPGPWRVMYTIQTMDDAQSDKKMTPYSDVRFALYRIENGTAVFDRTFGWQTIHGAKSRNNEHVFGTGDYALGVFVRNCKVDVAIEYHGKPAGKEHYGGI